MPSQLGSPNIGYTYFPFLFSLIMCEDTPLFVLISRRSSYHMEGVPFNEKISSPHLTISMTKRETLKNFRL